VTDQLSPRSILVGHDFEGILTRGLQRHLMSNIGNRRGRVQVTSNPHFPGGKVSRAKVGGS